MGLVLDRLQHASEARPDVHVNPQVGPHVRVIPSATSSTMKTAPSGVAPPPPAPAAASAPAPGSVPPAPAGLGDWPGLGSLRSAIRHDAGRIDGGRFRRLRAPPAGMEPPDALGRIDPPAGGGRRRRPHCGGGWHRRRLGRRRRRVAHHHTVSPLRRQPVRASQTKVPRTPSTSVPTATSSGPAGATYLVNSTPVDLTVAASNRCWVELRSGSASGPILFEGLLVPGTSHAFSNAPGCGSVWATRPASACKSTAPGSPSRHRPALRRFGRDSLTDDGHPTAAEPDREHAIELPLQPAGVVGVGAQQGHGPRRRRRRR